MQMGKAKKSAKSEPTAKKAEITETTPKKSDRATVSQRIEEVLRIRLDGAQFHDIVQYASEQKWNVSERQLWNYITRADELLVERQDKNRKKVVARHLAQRQSLYARAVNAGDYRTALAILADETKLRGLYPEKELRELVKLAAAQGGRIEELERRIHAVGLTSPTPPPASPPDGPAGKDTGEPSGPTGSVSG
jgi:hypothetical protein